MFFPHMIALFLTLFFRPFDPGRTIGFPLGRALIGEFIIKLHSL